MMTILWLVLVMGYGFFTWAAGDFSKAALSFLDGGYLAFLCFVVLPRAMGTELFYYTVGATGIGVIMGLLLEKKSRLFPLLVFVIVTACQMFWNDPLSAREVLFLAFFGGMGLYYASAGIIPDKIEIGKALISGAGFLVGTFLFMCS